MGKIAGDHEPRWFYWHLLRKKEMLKNIEKMSQPDFFSYTYLYQEY